MKSKYQSACFTGLPPLHCVEHLEPRVAIEVDPVGDLVERAVAADAISPARVHHADADARAPDFVLSREHRCSAAHEPSDAASDTSSAPSFTCSPALKNTCSTTPSPGAVIACSIFIAS